MRRAIQAGLIAAAMVTAPARAQEKQGEEPKLTARELFFSTLSEKAPTKAAAARRAPAPKQKSPEPVAAAVEPARTKVQAPEPAAPQAEPRRSGPPLVNASAVRRMPLGLRYSLLKWTGGRNYQEVDTGTVFRAGDRLRISVEANDSGYLYIVQKGATGTWDVLFPNSGTEGGENRIEAGRRETIPRGGRFTFDENAGEIRLFVVLSRQPEEDLHQLIYSTKGRQGAPQPAPKKPETKPGPMLLAQGGIGDDVIEKIKGRVYTRDLVFEKVDEEETGQKPGEKAMYVVNAEGGDDARVVAEIRLIHR
jgi:hypothetical protein